MDPLLMNGPLCTFLLMDGAVIKGESGAKNVKTEKKEKWASKWMVPVFLISRTVCVH